MNNNKYLDGIKVVIFDLDGTLYFKDKAIEGASDTLTELRKQGYVLRFVTNTDSLNRKTIAKNLNNLGIVTPLEEIFTCSTAAVGFLEKQKSNKCYLLCSDDVIPEFEHLPKSEDSPDYIVVGDFRDKFNYDNVKNAFRGIMNGADIIAMQDSPYFYKADGIHLDTGAYVKMLEYASGRKARSVGKPAREFFEIALRGVEVEPENIVVIGDDLTSDIKGAKNLSAKSILVRTGKFSEETLAKSDVKPDFIIESVAELIK